ncbi:DASH complex subunit Dad2p [Monosporozyma unispora]|nr:DASH complex subunit dad2 [Kazachstania unispora]
MSTIDSQIASKQKELESLKKITELTDTMKSHLTQLSEQVKDIETDGSRVASIMNVWDTVTESISAAGLGLLRYGEDNYKVGEWQDDSANATQDKTGKPEQENMPLPEGLVRVSATTEDT